jgi:predicted  nucleic acid-binding Zn-ribbon protein
MASSSHSEASALSVMTAAKEAVVHTLPHDPFRQSIEALRREQDRLRDEKKAIARNMRNTKRRMSRLKGKARELSDEDLVAVLMMRKEAAEKSKAWARKGMEEEQDERSETDDLRSKKNKTDKGEPCAAASKGVSPAPEAREPLGEVSDRDEP